MDSRMLIRIGAIMALSIAVTVTALEMVRREDAPASTMRVSDVPDRGPLRASLRRCQQLGQAAAADAGCMRVWAETRDRFLYSNVIPEAR